MYIHIYIYIHIYMGATMHVHVYTFIHVYLLCIVAHTHALGGPEGLQCLALKCQLLRRLEPSSGETPEVGSKPRLPDTWASNGLYTQGKGYMGHDFG